jgi:hypothetical protein
VDPSHPTKEDVTFAEQSSEDIRMGFQNGSGSEKLLNCAACHEPMALDAEFCSECGVRRAIATGYEAVGSESESNTGSFSDGVFGNLNQGIQSFGNSIQESQQKLKSGVQKVSQIRFYFGERISRFSNFLHLKKKIVFAGTAGMLLVGSYILTQTLIFSTQNADTFSEKYIELVASRDISQIQKDSIYFPNPENLPVLPVRYQVWDEVEQVTWKTDSEWNGWLGKGKVTFAPVLDQKVDIENSVSIEIAAHFKSKWLIFREIDWVASQPVASIEMNTKIERNLDIRFNGLSAGTSNNPALSQKKYALLPGPVSIALNGSGFTKERVYSTFASSSNQIKPEFEPISYGLSPAQQSSARSRVVSELNNCLKRECGRLPYLTRSDFEFSNWPSSYLYVDYFNTAWSDSATCEAADYTVSSYQTARISMKCSASASASIKWILYRLWFTTYYDTGFDYDTFDLYVSADLSPLTNGSSVRVSSVSISG